jgi:GntR family transcriptional repressor for pyruvate dehydrogenase complex
MFKSVKHTKVSEEIVNQIKQLIIDGKLKPGDRLPPERELIKQLGVSRPSLREALNGLVSMGFLEVRQAKRTFVKSITSKLLEGPLAHLIKTDAQKIFDLIEVRKAIETWAAYQAAQKASQEDLLQLDGIFGEMKRAFEEGRSWEKQDADFHLAIAQATHNTIHMHIMSGIYDLLRESVGSVFKDRAKIKKLLDQHSRIINAIRNHSPDKARERILEHLNYVESEVKKAAAQ